jgi:hypothetical protein
VLMATLLRRRHLRGLALDVAPVAVAA